MNTHYATRLVGDNLTEAGAHRLASVIRDYWAERGYDVPVWLDRSEPIKAQGVCFPRSELCGGLPAGYRGPLAG